MEETMEEAMKAVMEEANAQAGGGGIAVANAVGGDFGMHRRLLLAVAMEVGERGGGEDFTAGNAAGGGVGRATAIGGAVGGAGGAGVAIANRGYLAKASLTALVIMAFNS